MTIRRTVCALIGHQPNSWVRHYVTHCERCCEQLGPDWAGNNSFKTRILLALHAFGHWLWCWTDGHLPDDAWRKT